MIILYILGFLLLIGILAKIFELIKAFIPYLLGIAAIVAVIVFFPVILPFIGIAVAILLVLLAIGAILYAVEAAKYRPFLTKLDTSGILDKRTLPNEDNNAISYAIEKGKALEMDTNYLLSAKLLSDMENHLSSRDVIAKTDIISAICKSNITDSSEMFSGLLSYMDHNDILISIGENCYVTRRLCQYCQTLLERKGAATAEEFSTFCSSSELSGKAKANVQLISNAALQWMVRQKTASNIDLSESKTVLYLAQNRSHSKMVQRVINLDEDD